MSAIFISHSSKDNAAAAELRKRLEAEGHRSVFLDFDPEDGIPAGRNWEQELYQRIRASRAVIVLCSRHSMNSRWCFMEITHARALGKDLFPVRVDDCEIEGVLTDRQVVDLTADPEEAYARLFRGILASGLDPADAFDWDGSRPAFPGLLAFQEEDAAIFFGRDEEIGEGLDLLNKVRRLGQTGLVLVLGSSGSGKSSFVRAGLLPRLRRDIERWLVVDAFRPRDDPARELAASLSRAFQARGREVTSERLRASLLEAMRPAVAPAVEATVQAPEDDEARAARERFLKELGRLEGALPPGSGAAAGRYLRLLRSAMQGPPAGAVPPGAPAGRSGEEDILAEVAADLRYLSRRSEATVLVVVDQFEELLGHAAEHEASRFLNILRQAIEQQPSRYLVLATMRSDFLDAFQATPALLDVRYESLSLGPLSPSDVAQIVERPAQVAAIDLESGLVQALVDDAETDDALPLLAFTLRELNERFGADSVLRLGDYRDRLGGLQGAVAKAADDLLAAEELSAEQEDRLRRAFLSMVRMTEEGTFARRGTHWEELPKEIHPLLERFVQARLLVAGSDDRGRTLEVAHEAIFRSWSRLVQWLKDSAEALRLRQEIHLAAQAWAGRGRDRDDLWRGARLALARELEARGDLPLEDLDHEFVSASNRAEREAIEAREARRRHVLRAVIGGAVGALVLATIAVVFMFKARAEARKARDHDRVAVAGEWLTKDPTKAALVLLELERPKETAYAIGRMREALSRSRLQAELTGHHEAVKRVVFSLDGRRVATASRDDSARVWEVGSPGRPLLLEGHEDDVDTLAFSPGGDRLLTASGDGTARVWRLDGGSEPVILRGHEGAVTAAVFDPVAGRVATSSVDGTARLWRLDGAGGEIAEVVLVAEHDDAVWRVAFSPDGRLLATGCEDGTARLYRLDGAPEPVVLRGHEGAVVDVAFAADGERLATASLDGTARLWSVDGSDPPVVLSGHEDAVTMVAPTPDGRRVLTVSEDGTVGIWSAEGRGLWRFSDHTARVAAARLDVAGERAVSVSEDRTARVWGLDGGPGIVLDGHQGPVVDAAFSPDGRLVATASEDGTARLWSVVPSVDPVVVEVARRPVVALSPDGELLATGGDDGVVELRSIDGGEAVRFEGHERPVAEVAFSPDGSLFVSASGDRTARVWRVDGAGAPVVLEGHEAGLTDAVFSSGGERILTGSRDGTARLWRPDGAGRPVVLQGHEGSVRTVAFSPDGRRAATASVDGTARIWSVEAGGEPVVLEGHEGGLTDVAFGPGGRRVVTASDDGTARVWSVAEGRETAVLAGHEGQVVAAVFSPDGSRVVTASADGTARIWSADGALRMNLAGHRDFLTGAAFGAGGRQVVTASLDRTVRVWPALESGEPVVLEGHRGGVTRALFTPEADRVITASEDGEVRIWAVGVDRLLELIRRSTALCLAPDFRRKSLGEAAGKAAEAHAACESARRQAGADRRRSEVDLGS